MSIEILAAAVVETAPLPAVFIGNRGFSAVDRTAAGIYVLTLDGGGIDAGSCSIQVTPRRSLVAARLLSFGVAHTSNTQKTITILQEADVGGSVLTDVNFSIQVLRVLP